MTFIWFGLGGFALLVVAVVMIGLLVPERDRVVLGSSTPSHGGRLVADTLGVEAQRE